MWFFEQLCSSCQDFNWLKGSSGLSAAAELLVKNTAENSPKHAISSKYFNCRGEALYSPLPDPMPHIQLTPLLTHKQTFWVRICLPRIPTRITPVRAQPAERAELSLRFANARILQTDRPTEKYHVSNST